MLNYAVQVILCISKSANITTHLKSYLWLLVKVRDTYKIPFLCHKTTEPRYVIDMLHKKSCHSFSTLSRSHPMPLLNRLAHSTAILGDRSFSFASSVWNSIPNDVRFAPSLSLFKSCLNMYLFCSVYKDLNFYIDHCTHVHSLAKLFIFCKLFLMH